MLVLLQEQFIFLKNIDFWLPDKKILNGKKITKTATKLSQTTLLTKL
jgi:hypothetical protein